MAPPTGGTGGGAGGGAGGPSILTGMTPAIIEQTKALKTNAEVLAQNQNLLGNVGLAEDEAAQKTNKFATALKEQALQSAQALSITNQLTGAITGFIGKLTEAAKLSKHYERMLTEVNEAQKLYIGSVNFSTSSMGNASAQMQKHITVLNRMKLDAVDLAKKYKVSVQEFDKVNSEVMGKFSTQIMAASKSQEKLKSIANTVFVMARTAGMETGEAVEFMNQRASATAKTFLEVEKDTKQLAIATDAYKNKLKELGVDTQRTLLTSKQLVNVLGEMQKQFEYGGVNLKVFGGMMGEFAGKLQAAGMSSNVAQKNLAAMGKLFADMSRPDLSDFFGTTVSMQIARTGGEGIIQDEKVKARVKEQLEAAKKGGVTSPVQLASIAGEAAQGDIGFQRAQAQSLLKATGGGGAVLHEMLKQKGFSGIGAVEAVNNLKKLASMSDEDLKSGKKENKDMLDKFNKLQKATEEGSTPEADSYKAVVAIRNTTERLERYVTQKLGVAIAAAVGGTIVTALAARFAAQKALGLVSAVGSGGAGGLLGKVAGAGGMLGRFAPAMAGGGAAGGGGMLAGAAAAAGPVAIATAAIIAFKHMIDIHGKAIWKSLKEIGGMIWDAVKPVVGAVVEIGKIINAALKLIGDVVGKIVRAALDIIKVVLKPITEAFKMLLSPVFLVANFLGKILIPTFTFLGKAVGIVINILKIALLPVIVPLVLTFKVLGAVLRPFVGLIKWAMDAVLKPLGKLLKPVFRVMDNISKKLKGVFDGVFKGIDTFFVKPIHYIGKALKAVGGVLKKVVGGIGKVITTTLKIALAPVLLIVAPFYLLGKAIKWVVGKLGGFKKALGLAIKIAFAPLYLLGKAIKWVVGKLGGFKKILSTIVNVALLPFKVIIMAITGVLGGLKKALGLVGKAAKWVYDKTIGKVVKGVKKVASKVWGGLKSVAGRIAGGAKKAAGAIAGAAKSVGRFFGFGKKKDAPKLSKEELAKKYGKWSPMMGLTSTIKDRLLGGKPAKLALARGVLDSLKDVAGKEDVIREYTKASEARDVPLGGAINPELMSQMKQSAQERGANLTITPGSGDGLEDSQFRSDPTTGDIKMKMPGSWVTIRKDDFKNSVSGVVTEALTKGT